MLGFEQPVHFSVSLRHGSIGSPEGLPGIHVDDQFQERHLRDVEFLPLGLVGEQGDALGVVDQIVDAVGSEIGQDRHDDGFVGVDGQISHAPAGTVLCAYGYLIPFPESKGFENQVELFNLSGHLGVVESLASDVVEGGLVPEFPGGSLQPLKVVRIVAHVSGMVVLVCFGFKLLRHL